MAYLADTNILLRPMQPGTPACKNALAALEALRNHGERMFVSSQNLIEFWNVATRPVTVNGLGMTATEAEIEVARIETLFALAINAPEVYSQWRQLVVAHNICGVQVHDTRLVAVMKVHQISHILTFNPSHFHRFEGIVVVHPEQVPGFYPPEVSP